MAKPVKRIRTSKRYTRREFTPVATTIGQLALAWNDLQEMLAVLFWHVMSGGQWNSPLAAWHSIRSDRSQREMLKAGVKASGMPAKFRDEIIWVIDEANRLENDRNNAVHTPLFYYDSPIARAANMVGVVPASNLGNPRARNLKDKKDLLTEFRWYRDRAMTLADYAHEIGWVLQDRQKTLRTRPSLPILALKSDRRGQRRRQPSK